MSQAQFEQTVMQELKERELREPAPFSDEWIERFRSAQSDLKETIEVMNERIKSK